jgi:hypothetical protein
MSESGEGNPQDQAQQKVDYRDYKFLGGKVAAIDQRVGEQGFVGAIQSIFDERGIHINPNMSEATSEVLSKKPTVIIATHPELGADQLAIIGALPKDRKDVSAVASVLTDRIGENTSDHILPIYGVIDQPTNSFARTIARKGLRGYLKMDDNRSKFDKGRDNVRSMTDAKDRINSGGIVVIFPEGAGGKDAEWQNGVGDIVVRSANPDLQVVFAKAKPNDRWKNNARLVTPKVKGFLGPSNIDVDFSDPHAVAEYSGNRKHEVTQILKEQYEEFVASIRSK